MNVSMWRSTKIKWTLWSVNWHDIFIHLFVCFNWTSSILLNLVIYMCMHCIFIMCVWLMEKGEKVHLIFFVVVEFKPLKVLTPNIYWDKNYNRSYRINMLLWLLLCRIWKCEKDLLTNFLDEQMHWEVASFSLFV